MAGELEGNGTKGGTTGGGGLCVKPRQQGSQLIEWDAGGGGRTRGREATS